MARKHDLSAVCDVCDDLLCLPRYVLHRRLGARPRRETAKGAKETTNAIFYGARALSRGGAHPISEGHSRILSRELTGVTAKPTTTRTATNKMTLSIIY